MLRNGTNPVVRAGRFLFWGRPRAYRWLGLARGRGDCLQNDFDVWIGGYPRSSNSFATAALRLGNPQLRVATHWHIPAFIINAVRKQKPGILLLRQPIDAALSWALFWEGNVTVDQALDYYLDFHQTLVPVRPKLFVASFEEITGGFESVLQRFNQKFGTSLAGLSSDDASLNRSLSYLEDWFRSPDGTVNEFRVPRPSNKRMELKKNLLEQIQKSSRTIQKLDKANEVYARFGEGPSSRFPAVQVNSVEATIAQSSQPV